MPINVTVCVGSSCHIRGSRAVLTRFAEMIKAEHLEDDVALVGSFCMERCGECMNWKLDGQHVASRSVKEAEETLRNRLVQTARRT